MTVVSKLKLTVAVAVISSS